MLDTRERTSTRRFIGKFNDVYVALESSGNQELAEALKLLKESVMASEALDDEQKADQVGVIAELGEEAAKPKPNKALLRMLGEGLMAGLRAVPDVAKAAAAAAPAQQALHVEAPPRTE